MRIKAVFLTESEALRYIDAKGLDAFVFYNNDLDGKHSVVMFD